MIKKLPCANLIKHTLGLASLMLASLHLPIQAANEPDLYLIQAFEGVWKMERSATTLLTDRINTRAEQGILFHEPQVKDAPVYLRKSYEIGEIEYRRKKYSSIETPWGSFPHLNPDTMRLIEISIPQTRYWVLSGQGENLFSATDWNRYRFLHVFDMGRSRYITNYYSVFSEAHLGERVLGRLPNSPVLNYARVVPAQWDANNNISSYEVLLYNLDRNGIHRTLEDGSLVSYNLTKNTDSPLWTLTPASTTPVADELDRKGHYFTGARLSAKEYQARLLESQPSKKQSNKKSTKKTTKKNGKPISQR